MNNSNNEVPKLKWRLRELMLREDIRSAAELSRLLAPYGIKLTGTQMARVVYKRPSRVSVRFLEVLIEVFKCNIGDLFALETGEEVHEPSIPEEAKAAVRKRSKSKTVDDGNRVQSDQLVDFEDGSSLLPKEYNMSTGPYKVTTLASPKLVKTNPKRKSSDE